MPNNNNLLSIKLDIPSLGQKIICRSRLINLLSNNSGQRVTLIDAPTGYGKTTLLVEWLSTDPDLLRHTAWVTLDSFDNSAYRFWSYIIAAISQVAPHMHINPQQILLLENDPPYLEELNPLINAIAHLPFRLTLVLDDLQSVKQDQIFLDLMYLINHQPKNLHIVLVSREALPIPLGRLRAQGRLVEVYEQDLSFTFHETKSYISGLLGMKLNQETVVTLQQITEGWIAGLQLAAISLKNQSALNQTFAGLSKGNQQIFSYLTEEVLNQQKPDIREFLLITAILSELSAPLCDELLGHNDSQAILIDLERSNLFISAVDKQHIWFRYHPLFAHALAETLKQAYPERLPALHRKAAAWLVANGFPEKAVSHALATGDLNMAAEIADSCALQAIFNYNLASVIYWTDRFSPNLIARYPKLGIYSAVASCQLSRFTKVEPELQFVEHALEGMDNGSQDKLDQAHLRWEIAAIRAVVDCALGNFSKAIPIIVSLLQEQPKDDLFFSGWLNHYLARAYEALEDFGPAAERYDQGRRFAQQNKMHYVYMHTTSALIHLYKIQGKLNQAEMECQNALNYAYRENLDFSLSVLPQIFLTEIRQDRSTGSINVPWADKTIAQIDQIEKGPLAVSTKLLIFIGLAKYFLAQCENEHALIFFNRAVETAVPGDALLFNTLSELVDLQVQIWAAMGTLSSMGDAFVRKIPLNKFAQLPSVAIQSARSRIYFSRGYHNKVLQILDEVEMVARKSGMTERLLKTLILKALSYYKIGQTRQALECLDEALEWTVQEGYVHIFLVEDEASQPLFVRYLADLKTKMDDASQPKLYYASKIIDAFEDIDSKEPSTITKFEPNEIIANLGQVQLSCREKEVLRLLDAGKSTKEIAAILNISNNTAKTHARNIYQKVGKNIHEAE
jgi:LuxR family maltose regulon positive regulatory protein